MIPTCSASDTRIILSTISYRRSRNAQRLAEHRLITWLASLCTKQKLSAYDGGAVMIPTCSASCTRIVLSTISYRRSRNAQRLAEHRLSRGWLHPAQCKNSLSTMEVLS